MDKIIKVRNFTKRYGDFKAVNNISFDVEKGSIFAFLGPNGAGKSTTINTLCTILDKTEGEVILNGHDVSKEKSLVRKDIGIVFQDSTLDDKMTVEENLRFHCELYDVPKREVENRIDFALTLVELMDWKYAVVAGLSGGMKRRVEIARGLVHYPKILFLDEPTTGLDPQTRANVWEYILKLQKEKDITIFLTTHYMEEAEICSKIVIMDHGIIVENDTPDNLKRKYTKTRYEIKSTNPNQICEILRINNILFDAKEDKVTFFSKEPNKVLNIMNLCNDNIIDFEVKKGTLNDVFLEMTGKEIRA